MIKVHYFSRSGGLKKYFRPNSVLSIPTISITNGSTANVDEAATLQLNVNTTGNPTPTVSYQSSDTLIATVNSSGLVTGVAEGSCVITATATNSQGTASDTLNLTVQAVVSPLIWEDDFETNQLSSYFEYNNGGGSFVRTAGAGRSGGYGMVCTYAPAQTEGGNLKIAFGRTPDAYFAPIDDGTQDYREIYWRFWVKLDSNWQINGGAKLTRATVFANANWAQAMIGHVWAAGTGDAYLGADPARGTDVSGNLVTTEYNDTPNLTWLGLEVGSTPFYSGAARGQWHSVETHIKLNDAGQSNGIFEVWIDDVLEIQRTDLNWVGAYNAYGINVIMLETFINEGAAQAQTITFDDFAISTERIYSGATNTVPTISITNGATADITDGDTLQLSVSTSGVPTPTVTYGSSNESVATVNSTGLITSVAEGTCTITATATNSEGSASDTIDVTVTPAGALGTISDLSAQAGDTEVVLTWTSAANAVSHQPQYRQTGSSTWIDFGSVLGASATTVTVTGLTNDQEYEFSVVASDTSAVTPDITEDFSTYTSTANMISDPRGIYDTAEDFLTNRIVLDTTVGYGASDRSMRYDYPLGTSTDYTISRMIALANSTTEVWVESVIRFSPDFTVDGNGQGAGPALKLQHVEQFGAAGGGRFGINIEGSTLRAEGPNDAYEEMYIDNSLTNVSHLFDGNWHTLRYHVRLGATDFHQLWEDGVDQGSASGTSAANELWGVALARNLNMLSDHAMEMWWGQVKIWYTDPGW